jgi:hypothetical protein
VSSWTRDALRGVVAGAIGTAAMTVFMNPGLVGLLPRRYRPDLFVPRQVVQWAEVMVGRPDSLPPTAERAIAGLTHVAYGATMGMAFALGPARVRRLPPAAAGALWGVTVWAAGYQGWLPAAGVRPPTTHQPPSKWPVPIGNHLVFGIVTGLAHERLRARSI